MKNEEQSTDERLDLTIAATAECLTMLGTRMSDIQIRVAVLEATLKVLVAIIENQPRGTLQLGPLPNVEGIHFK